MPDGIEIYFNENLTAAQRDLAAQSVASMVERRRAETKAARARLAEEAKLRDAIMAPVAKLMQTDAGAAEAANKLGLWQIEAVDTLRLDGLPSGPRDLVIPVTPLDNVVEIRTAPYDFGWRWHDTGGSPPYNQSGDQNGRLAVDARSGADAIPGGANSRVSAHIGVGVIVRLDRPTVIELSATRSGFYSFVMGARGVDVSATSEGGLETTFIRGGTDVLMAGNFPQWHKRVSGFEEARDRSPTMTSVYPNGMGGRIETGEYAYNVGIWAFADHSSGIGNAGAQSIVQSTVLDMQIKRR